MSERCEMPFLDNQKSSVSIFDSTLRDGAQGTGIAFTVEDKLAVVRLLDQLGVAYIEAGNPGSNPKDDLFFQELQAFPPKQARVVSFGSTCRKDTDPSQDENLLALLRANTPCCAVFGKAWRLQVEHVLGTSPEENFRMIEESCRFLKAQGREVIFDAEHFFDGWLEEEDFAWAALEAAFRGGADLLCLCDTNGGLFPSQAKEIVAQVVARTSVPIAVHFHDDGGMAVANSVESVLAGAVQVQGTLLGFGERCGNANLVAVISNLQLKKGFHFIPQEKLLHLFAGAREMAAIANVELSANAPYVGENAFAHKAGMHANGVLKLPRSFEHVDPILVGNTRRFPASEISGRAVIWEKIRGALPDLPSTSIAQAQVGEIVARIKQLEAEGYQFEGADASFELLVRKTLGCFSPFFRLLYYHIYTDYDPEKAGQAGAMVKVQVGDRLEVMAAEGNGPVHALDAALRKALEVFYPVLSDGKLTDYKVRVLDGKQATAARVRVLITFSRGSLTYTTVGVSSDVVAASWKALEDSVEYLLLKTER